jgi:hypothetical protein
MTDISPSLRQAIEAIAHDRTHGAAWLAREAAGVMGRAASEIPAGTPEQMASSLRDVARSLAAGQPRMAAVGNAVGAVALAASASGGAAPGDVAAARRAAVAETRRIVAGWERNVASSLAAQTVVPKVRAHAATRRPYSGTGAPGQAQRAGHRESQPLGGRTTARLLESGSLFASSLTRRQVHTSPGGGIVVGPTLSSPTGPS